MTTSSGDDTPGLVCFRAGGITIAEIKSAVCAELDLPFAAMTSRRRDRPAARARQVAMHLARELTPHSLPNLGRLFGGRDHTTVIHALRKVESLSHGDPTFAATVTTIKNRIVSEHTSATVDNSQIATSLLLQQAA